MSAAPPSPVSVADDAAVTQHSPLRYPGGKTWLVPHIRKWLDHTKPEILIEPFAGGAIVSLTAVMEDLAPAAVMVEIDRDVAAFWRSALESGAALGKRVRRFEADARKPARDREQSASHGRGTRVPHAGSEPHPVGRHPRAGRVAS